MLILLTGAGGFVGSHLARALTRFGGRVVTLYRQNRPTGAAGREALQVDTTDPAAVQSAVLEVFPDVIINAAAVSELAAVEADPGLALALNVELPRELARLAHHLGGRIIHLSTEQVFDGTADSYAPTDLPAPRHLYGQQKLLAEREVLRSAPKSAVVLRLPLIMGNSPCGDRSPHEKLLHDLAAGRRPTHWTDVLRRPTSAANIATLVAELVERPNLYGLFHWAGTETVSRAELATAIWSHFSDHPAPWVESPCPHDHVPRRLVLTSPNLLGKVKCQPATLAQQLSDLEVPSALLGHPALAALGVRMHTSARLRQGVDF